jgi:hypothetical protein
MSRGRALHGGEALYRDMRAGARRDFTCLESRRAPGKMGSRLGRTVVVLGEFAFARRARTAVVLLRRGRDFQLERRPITLHRILRRRSSFGIRWARRDR